MNILVCIKQVPDPETLVFPEDGSGPVRAGGFRMNRFDEFALEEALRIREQLGTVRVEAVTVGPQRTVEVLKRAMGMGADSAFLVPAAAADLADPFAVAARIAAFARGRGYDLVLTGVMSEDAQQAQVGPMLAALLELPCATAVVSQQLTPGAATVRVKRELEGGRRERVSLDLPALLTIQTGINTPRYPTLSNLLRANRTPPERFDAETGALPKARQQVLGTVAPQQHRAGRELTGSTVEKARTLLGLLREKGLIQ